MNILLNIVLAPFAMVLGFALGMAKHWYFYLLIVAGYYISKAMA